MRARHLDVLSAAWILSSVAVVALAIVGGMRSYSPVPYWDMWDGYISFYMNSSDPGIWFSQHNEHRIVLSRLLMWLDMFAFGGESFLLIAVNYLALALCALTLVMIWRQLAPAASRRQAVLTASAIFACLFAWVQRENLVVGFQTCFFLVNLLALWAFYLMHKACAEKAQGNFLLSCLLGVGAAYALASGVLVLPLLFAYAVLMGMDNRRKLFIAVTGLLAIGFYFRGYIAPGHHGALLGELLKDPVGFAEYVVLYLGSPFHHLMGGGARAHQFAVFAGSGLMLCFLFSFYQAWRMKEGASLRLALLMFVAYVVIGAVVTAGGRLNLGVEQALSLRYSTPVLMAWVAMFILLSTEPVMEKQGGTIRLLSFFLGLAVLLLVLRSQFAALRVPETTQERAVAALALELEVNDRDQIMHIYPIPERARDLTRAAKKEGLSIFAHAPLAGARENLGREFPPAAARPCLGYIDGLAAIKDEERYLRIIGWLFEPQSKAVPEFLTFTDEAGRIIGYAYTGGKRPDVAAVVGKAARRAGFDGYVLKTGTGGRIDIHGGDACVFSHRAG